MKDMIRETLAFKDLSPEEKEKRGILGRLYGPIADVINPTRNGRAYSDELWEKVFNENEIVKELLAKGGIPGELDHPAERDEIDSSKIAIMMPEAPKKDKDGHLIGYFDILDTPNGRIAYELAKYGFQLGISSRGSGDVLDDDTVDPNTYDFKCFDLVLIPSVKDARLHMTEGLSPMTFKQAICESLEKAKPDEQKIMKETLEDLNIDIDKDDKKEDVKDGPIAEKREDIAESESGDKEEASDAGATMIKDLQEALKSKADLEAKTLKLQEQLAVSNTKVSKLNEDLNSYKKVAATLSNIAIEKKALQSKVNTLEETLKVKSNVIKSQEAKINTLVENEKVISSNKQTLNESISNKDKDISKLNESIVAQKKTYESQITKLNEDLKKIKTDSSKQIDEWKERTTKAVRLNEQYKKLAFSTVDSYIEAKSAMIDVTPEEIKNRLPESYTINDINKVCESLQNYKLNMGTLPFSLDRKVKKVSITESSNNRIMKQNSPYDDDIDDNLLNIAGLK